jgi:hypothetical protein
MILITKEKSNYEIKLWPLRLGPEYAWAMMKRLRDKEVGSECLEARTIHTPW